MMSVSSQTSFIPRWRKKSSPHKHCCVPGCVNPTQKVTKLVNHEQICEFFSMPDIDNLETNYMSRIHPVHNPLRTMDFFHLLGWLGVRIKKSIHLLFSQHTQHQCLCSIQCQKTTLSLYTLELLRERIRRKIKCEEEIIPSDEA